MQFVLEDGWSKETIRKGAEQLGYAPTAHSLIPNGPASLVHYFTVKCNEQLAEQMQKSTKDVKDIEPKKFIEDSIITRLEMIEPYKKSWSDALAIVVSGGMAVEQMAALLKLADDIAYYSGDRSVDFNWYARRGVIASIYSASQLHWLGSGKDTRAFTADQLNRAFAFKDVPKYMSALFTTVQNIIPINRNR